MGEVGCLGNCKDRWGVDENEILIGGQYLQRPAECR